jgi:Icc-related predicted phosphoesterase
MIEVLFTSDIHCHPLREVVGKEEADVLCIVGDLTFRGTDKELKAFELDLQFVRHQFKQIIWTGGNHDLGLEDYKDRGYGIAQRTNTVYLNEEVYTYEGIRFYGSPQSCRFGSWAFMYDRPTNRWADLPQATVYMIHGPAAGLRDQLESGERVGCWDLAHKLEKMNPKPRIVATGHIHSQYGTEEKWGIKFLGCSAVNEMYQLENPPHRITL